MYIKYKSLSNQKVLIINVNLSNCKTITTEDNKLLINNIRIKNFFKIFILLLLIFPLTLLQKWFFDNPK